MVRKPYQGVWNVLRFNWHFYMLAIIFVLGISLMKYFVIDPWPVFTSLLCLLATGAVAGSLAVSFYVYDRADFYGLDWLEGSMASGKNINIHAGFDETSVLLKAKFPRASWQVFDFYDPSKHTEISIKRARKAYPACPGTEKVDGLNFPLADNYADHIFLIFSAHEIRKDSDRIAFFRALQRMNKDSGKIVVTEHLRDLPNFLAYNIGFFHFIPRSSWYTTFGQAGLKVAEEKKITPFVTTFILENRGVSY